MNIKIGKIRNMYAKNSKNSDREPRPERYD